MTADRGRSEKSSKKQKGGFLSFWTCFREVPGHVWGMFSRKNALEKTLNLRAFLVVRAFRAYIFELKKVLKSV